MITEILTSGLLLISPIIPQNEPPDFRSVECLAKNMYFELQKHFELLTGISIDSIQTFGTPGSDRT